MTPAYDSESPRERDAWRESIGLKVERLTGHVEHLAAAVAAFQHQMTAEHAAVRALMLEHTTALGVKIAEQAGRFQEELTRMGAMTQTKITEQAGTMQKKQEELEKRIKPFERLYFVMIGVGVAIGVLFTIGPFAAKVYSFFTTAIN